MVIVMTVTFIWSKIVAISSKIGSENSAGRSDLNDSKKRVCCIALLVGVLQMTNVIVSVYTSTILEDWNAGSNQVWLLSIYFWFWSFF
jgi:hypothetical protein